MLLVITGGVLLLGVFALFGKLWGGDVSGVAAAAKVFVPVWLGVALVNMCVGVTRAGYRGAGDCRSYSSSSPCRLSSPR